MSSESVIFELRPTDSSNAQLNVLEAVLSGCGQTVPISPSPPNSELVVSIKEAEPGTW